MSRLRPPLDTCEARTVKAWRAWLRAHHRTAREVWLVFHKQHTGVPSIDYGDALDEALCFGWIDSLVKRLDDNRYARKFTPRKPDSRWSPINVTRYAVLREAGRLQPAGIARAPTGRTYAPRPVIPEGIPADIRAALKARPAAWQYFESLPPSHRQRFVGWIVIAKREETKARRLTEVIRLLAAGKTLGLK